MSSRTRRVSSKQRAAAVLKKAGKDFRDNKLILLATSMRVDPMAAVKTQIDAMVAELKKTQVAEDDKKEYCRTEIRQNEVDTSTEKKNKASIEQKMADLAQTS